MKLKILSDLHLEMYPFILTNNNNVDTLILAGDILVASMLKDHPRNDMIFSASQKIARDFRKFILDASVLFKNVIVIAGNHEFYHGHFYKSLNILRDEYSQYFNIHFLEDECITIDGIKFIGSTLWTDINKLEPKALMGIRNMINDYVVIFNDKNDNKILLPIDTYERHQISKAFITNELNKSKDEKVVVVTHHLPSWKSVHTKYLDGNLLNAAFVSDLDNLIIDNPQIKLWVHGHAHDGCEYNLGNTKVVCNPRGYASHKRNENTNFNEDFIIDIGDM